MYYEKGNRGFTAGQLINIWGEIWRDEEKMIKIGDTIEYTPKMIGEDKPAKGVIKKYEKAGDIFRMDMLCIDEVAHWIPARECKKNILSRV